MGALRTINHPGLEVREYDLSDYVATVGGTTSLVIGFSPQGQSGVPVIPTSTTSVKSYFGTPKTEAERYFFYACKEVFDKGGNLIAARIPYNNNAQYLTPSVTYDIETWQTTHTNRYSPVYQVSKATSQGAEDERILTIPSDKVERYVDRNGNTISPSVKTFKVYIGDDSTTVYAIQKYYDKSIGATSTNSELTLSSSLDKLDQSVVPDTYVFTYDSTNDVWKRGTETIEFGQDGYCKYGFKIAEGTAVDKDEITVVYSRPEQTLECKESSFYKISLTSEGKNAGVTELEALGNSAYFTVELFVDDALYYFTEKFVEDTTVTSATSAAVVTSNLYAAEKKTKDGETVCNVGDKLDEATVTKLIGSSISTVSTFKNRFLATVKGCVYDPVKKDGVNYPVLATVKKYNETGFETVVGVKSYWIDGEGAEYPSCIPTDFIEYTLESAGETALENAGVEKPTSGKYTAEQIVENVKYLSSMDCFSLTHQTFVAELTTKETALSKSFKGAPISSDVTTGYVITIDGGSGSPVKIDVSKQLSIPAASEWNDDIASGYVELTVADPFEDGNYRYVAKTIPGYDSYAYSKDDFYEFSSAFTTISGVALAGSQNYKWIHWKTAATSATTDDEGTAKYIDNSVMMSAIAGMELSAVPNAIADIENLVTIKPNSDHFGFIPLSTYQNYRDGAESPDRNKIVICNITEKQFDKDDFNNSGMECLGILPILVGGLQAIPKQQIIQLPEDTGNGRIFNAVESIVRGNLYDINVPESDGINCKYTELNGDGFYKPVANTDTFAPYDSAISNDVLGNVPSIQLNSELKPDGIQKNAVTLVVCELAISKSFDNKVYVNLLERWTGSLDKDAVDNQNKSIFIDNIVNSEDSGSSYVKIFSNFNYAENFKTKSTRNQSTEEYISEQTPDNTATLVVPTSLGSELWFTKAKEVMSIGFTSEQTKKYIAYSTIAATLESIFDTLSNVDETIIDVVVDAGLSTIANRIKRICDEDPEVLKAEYAPFWERIKDVDAIAGWKSICAKYITFCSSTRKDCMAVVDAPRNLSVYNDVKLVKNPKYSIDFDIMPSLTYLAGLNSSYCAQYANWVSYVDDFSGKTIWLPPSIMANGAIVYTDYNAQYFDAPAGTKRGLITAGIDVSFNPNARQQDNLYGKSWNYCISTTSDGIVLWGQKTSQTRPSAFDRINVRRLFLRLERLTRNAMKAFVFEGNTEKLRNRVVDMLTPIYENCKTNGGLYDYQIICDSRNNTDTSIDNNELRTAILLKPTKTAEFIILDFYALSTGMDFAEAYSYL